MRRGVCSLWLVVCASCGGIGEPVDPYHCQDNYCVGGEQTFGYFPYYPRPTFDIVLVLDDSVPAGPDAARLQSGLDELAAYMRSPVSGNYEVNANVALVPATMTVENGGELWPRSPYCALPSGAFLHSAELCDAPPNYQGDLADVLSCAAMHMPASGKPPRPLATLRALLAPNGPLAASGFLRKDAYLLLGIVSAQDDPDLADPAALGAFHDLLATLFDYPEERVLASVVAPAAAQGLAGFAKSFGDNAAFSDIAAERWDALSFVTRAFRIGDGSFPCIGLPFVDADPATDGVQPDCVATEIHLAPTSQTEVSRTEEILPRCPESETATEHCWRTASSPNRCRFPNELELIVDPPHPSCLPSYVVKYTFTCTTRLQ